MALSARLDLRLTDVRRMLHRLEGRNPALVRQSFDADLEIEVWTTTPAALNAIEE